MYIGFILICDFIFKVIDKFFFYWFLLEGVGYGLCVLIMVRKISLSLE